MNLALLSETDAITEEDRRAILHEFGHVLGLIEEHLNPKADLPWNKEEVYATLSGPLSNWSQNQIDFNRFRKFKPGELPDYREFDPEAVMNTDLPRNFFEHDIQIRRGLVLSRSDKAFVARLYPR
jgi:serralysin